MDIMKELTFKEIIANIKEGEVWENKKNRVVRIYINEEGNITLEGDDYGFSINYSTCVDPNSIYKLKRKEYTFEEALKICQNDEKKTMESSITRYVYKIYKKGFFCFDSDLKCWVCSQINYEEVVNKWYIK